MYSRYDYLLFVYFLILPSLLHSSILFNCFLYLFIYGLRYIILEFLGVHACALFHTSLHDDLCQLPFGSVKVAVPLRASLFCTTSWQGVPPHRRDTCCLLRWKHFLGCTLLMTNNYSLETRQWRSRSQLWCTLLRSRLATVQPLKWGHPAPTTGSYNMSYLPQTVTFPLVWLDRWHT